MKILETISDSILNDRSNFTVSYVLIHHKRPHRQNTIIDSKVTIQMTIRQELTNGQFLKLWKGILRKKAKQELCSEKTTTTTTNNNNNSNTEKEDGISTKDDEPHVVLNNNDTSLEISFSLSQSLKKAQSEIKKLKSEKEQIMLELAKWKDTAMKLENAWDQEKTELFQNFLTLYNRVKAELRKTRNELREQTLNPVVLSNNKLKRQSNVNSSPSKQNDIIDHVEEHDILHFDPDEVDRLASVSLNPTTKPATITTDVTTILSQEGNDAMNWSQTSTVHKNIYTGATEIFLDTKVNESNNDGSLHRKKRKRLNNLNSIHDEPMSDENVDQLLVKHSSIVHKEIEREESRQKNTCKAEENDCLSVESSECGSEPLL